MRKFLTDVFDENEANVIAFGVQLGKFAKAELKSIRDASWFVEPYDVDKNVNLLENVRVFDSGDLKLGSLDEITQNVKKILDVKKIPLMLGSNHLSSLYSLKAFLAETKLVVFDAHCDLKDEYMDEKIAEMGLIGKKSVVDNRVNDSTWLRRLSDIRNPKNIILLGIRSADEDEINFAKKSGILYYTSNDIKDKTEEIRLILNQFTKLSNVYISLDIDVFDTSIAPAVDYPEPNGIFFNKFKELVSSIGGRLVGLDICCLNPINNNQITEFLAVRSVFEILSKL